MGRNRHNQRGQRAQRRQQPPAAIQLVSPRTGIVTPQTDGALAVAGQTAERRGDVSLLFAERGATGGGSAAFQQQQYAAAQAQMAYSTRVNQAQGMWNPTGKPYPQMPEVPDNKPLLQAMGATGTAIFSGIIASEEYNSDFYWKDAIAIYEQMMRNDAQVFATINLMEEPIRRCTWSIEPASDDPVDLEIASFIESCLFHDMVMETTEGRKLTQKWDDILRHILMSFRFGFSAFEQVWRIEDGWVKWARWEPLLPRTIWRWWVGDDNQLVGVQQWTFKNYSYRFIDIPADKLLLFVHRQEGNNYDGVSILRSAYKHWWYKQNFEKIEAIDIERNAVAVPVIGLPESFSNADVQAAEKILANLRANQSMGVTLPPGWTFEYARNFAKTTTQVQPSIQYHDVMIARNILGQFLNLGSTEAGSYALAATHLDLFRSLLQAEVEWIEDVINTDAIPRLCDYNYDGIAVYPKLKASKIAAQDVGVITDALSKLCNMPTPLITPGPEIEDFLRKELGLPSAPASQIEGTNPTQEQEPPEDSEDDGEGEDEGDENEPQTQESTSTSGRPVASAPGTGDEGPAGTSEGVSGMLLREQMQEARLLRETLDAAYGVDAVERGMTFYSPSQARGRDGKWVPEGGGRQPTGGDGAGGGAAPGGGAAAGPKAPRGAGAAANAKAGGSAKGTKAGGKAKGAKPAKAPDTSASSKPITVEEQKAAAELRLKTAQRQANKAERDFRAAEKAAEAKRETNRAEIDRLSAERHEAYIASFKTFDAAKEAIAEERAQAKGTAGATKTAVTNYQKMLAAKQPYEDAKVAYEAAKAARDASEAHWHELYDRYSKQYAPNQRGLYARDPMMRDHPDLKEAFAQSMKDSRAYDKAQRTWYRAANAYESPRGKLAGKITPEDIEAHPLHVGPKAALAAADAKLAEATGQRRQMEAFNARLAARNELQDAQMALAHPTWKYPLHSAPTQHALYTSVEQWPQGMLNAVRVADTANTGGGRLDRHVGDRALSELQHAQGFDGKPDIVSEADFAKYVKAGEVELWRGDSKSSHTDNMMMGEYHAGIGVHGSGTYTALASVSGRETARGYAGNDGLMTHMTVKKDARVIDYDHLKTLASKALARADREEKAARANGDRAAIARALTLRWLASGGHGGGASHLAVALGYDAINVNTSRTLHGQWIILNRTALRISHQVHAK